LAAAEYLAETESELLFLVAGGDALDFRREDGLVLLPCQVEVRFWRLTGAWFDAGVTENAGQLVLGAGVSSQALFGQCRIDAERISAAGQAGRRDDEQRAGFPPAEDPRRRDGYYLHGQLRPRLGSRGSLRRRVTVPGRIDYYYYYNNNDPGAPKANSLVPSVNVVMTDEDEKVLVIQRSDNGNWAIPGGAVDLGESLTQAAVRETREETGITCEITGIVGIYTDPRHVILYTSNGEARQEFSIVLTARAVGGASAPSDESSQVRWVTRDELAECPMDRSMRLRVDHFLADRRSPYLG